MEDGIDCGWGNKLDCRNTSHRIMAAALYDVPCRRFPIVLAASRRIVASWLWEFWFYSFATDASGG